jgi:TetR/AcrR family transcriptional repressor of bet genes
VTAGRTPRFARKPVAARRAELIDAAIACLAEGGLQAFTIDNLCRRAGVSRGLVNHHFAGKAELMVRAYERMLAEQAERLEACAGAPGTPERRLVMMIDAVIGAGTADRAHLRAWLALWGEISSDLALQAVHRERYAAYRRTVRRIIADVAAARGRTVDADALAALLIALVDGLWLEWSLDAGVLTLDEAKAGCLRLLEPHLGSLQP